MNSNNRLIVLLLIGVVLMSGCNDNSSIIETDENPDSIKHKGLLYNKVISPYTDRVWLDRNLGAKRVCSAFDDTLCYGDNYQWGRDADGHEKVSNKFVSKQAVDFRNAGTLFIASSLENNYDWAQKMDNNGSLRSKIWSQTDGTSICPVGYRVPTISELEDETTNSSDGMFNNIDAFNNFLKLPSAGVRSSYYGSKVLKKTGGVLWSTTTRDHYSYYLGFFQFMSGKAYGKRANAVRVRCIRDKET